MEEDLMNEKQILSDEKQCAEHIMLVSKNGSVKVEKLMNVKRYSHVMHRSTKVRTHALTIFEYTQKVKPMVLIDQMETAKRGPYSGGFGGISFAVDMDIVLALRTMVFPTGNRFYTMYLYKDKNQRREWVAHLQAGVGIVADSVQEDEQKECQNKAAGLSHAIDPTE
ncbi:Chorismate-utilizing enzyme, C-terminal [Dillenia turbinata]|uniref:Chorismate-utilizing enzyme, C-terminal n=1 Tax=Dillenia turbinata TaxID=194707 RepID=A0AAN8VKU8_9MAGN